MSRIFNSIQPQRPGMNIFDLSHEIKLTMGAGTLIPFFVEEVVPSDTFRISSEQMMRLSPLVAPIMHRVNVHTQFFYVRNRTIWKNFEPFITGGKDGKQAPLLPQIAIGEGNKEYFKKGMVPDYMGIPIPQDGTLATNVKISQMPFRAYCKIYNDFLRDPNLEDEIDFGYDQDGEALNELTEELTKLRRRKWERDYFTSALTDTQRGDPVSVPIDIAYNNPTHVIDPATGNVKTGSGDRNLIANSSGVLQVDDTVNEAATVDNIDPDSTGMTIENIRLSARLQEWLERAQRSGYRLNEVILSFFNQRTRDATLDRAEFLGGTRAPLTITEVLQTGETGTSPQGNMAGHGISVGRSKYIKRRFDEHGYVIGLMSIVPRTLYSQGIDRMWLRATKNEFYWPNFANLGEQPVLNREVFMNWLALESTNGATFGYQSRYAEFKQRNSRIAGDFRDTLRHWHMAREFLTTPALEEAFVSCDPREDIFAVTDPQEDKYYVQIYNHVRARRPMPKYGTPRL